MNKFSTAIIWVVYKHGIAIRLDLDGHKIDCGLFMFQLCKVYLRAMFNLGRGFAK